MTVRRVLMVVWWLDEAGGMERDLTELALALTERGVMVTVVSERPLRSTNRYRMQLEAAGVRILAPNAALAWLADVKKRGMSTRMAAAVRSLLLRHFRSRNEDLLPANPLLDFAAGNLLSARLMTALRTESDTHRPDVVHVYGCGFSQAWVSVWARQKGIASLYREGTTISAEMPVLWEGSGAALAASATLITSTSNRSLAAMAPHLPGRDDLRVVRHIVSAPNDADSNLKRYDIATVGRLELHKGIDVLLAALARLKRPMTVAIAGDGTQRQNLERDRAGLKEAQVTFLGLLSDDAVRTLLGSARIFVLPSRTEGMSVAMIEALAHGVPVIATDAGGTSEVLEDGVNGLLVPVDDPDALAAAIERLLSDADLQARLSAGARMSFGRGRHDQKSVATDTIALYEEAIARVAR